MEHGLQRSGEKKTKKAPPRFILSNLSPLEGTTFCFIIICQAVVANWGGRTQVMDTCVRPVVVGGPPPLPWVVEWQPQVTSKESGRRVGGRGDKGGAHSGQG